MTQIFITPRPGNLIDKDVHRAVLKLREVGIQCAQTKTLTRIEERGEISIQNDSDRERAADIETSFPFHGGEHARAKFCRRASVVLRQLGDLVFCWRDRANIFVESKRKGHDHLNRNQRAWLESALRVNIPLDNS